MTRPRSTLKYPARPTRYPVGNSRNELHCHTPFEFIRKSPTLSLDFTSSGLHLPTHFLLPSFRSIIRRTLRMRQVWTDHSHNQRYLRPFVKCSRRHFWLHELTWMFTLLSDAIVLHACRHTSFLKMKTANIRFRFLAYVLRSKRSLRSIPFYSYHTLLLCWFELCICLGTHCSKRRS